MVLWNLLAASRWFFLRIVETALTGDLPTIYVYSINNVGEALLAKRRILSTIVSHTTPPFIDAPLSDENVKLLGLLNRFDPTEPEEVQREIANKI